MCSSDLLALQLGLGLAALVVLPLVLILAIVSHQRSNTIARRSLWMGVIIGTASWLIVGGGLCIPILSQA